VISGGASPLGLQFPSLPPGAKGLKFMSIRGPSGLIPWPNGEGQKAHQSKLPSDELAIPAEGAQANQQQARNTIKGIRAKRREPTLTSL
jgi:hypothetical protein